MHIDKTYQCGISFKWFVDETAINNGTVASKNSDGNMHPSNERAVLNKVN